MKENFVISKLCENNNGFDCWVDTKEKVFNCCPNNNSKIFIDNSGRAWAQYSNLENMYVVDTNGNKKPNKLGKDRWIFTLGDSDGKRIAYDGKPGIARKVIPFTQQDVTYYSINTCQYPPCYFKTWLYE